LMGILNRNNYVDCELLGDCETHVYISKDDRFIEVGLLIMSLYWTTMVIKNIVRVAVAGAIGGPWWFGVDGEPDGNYEEHDGVIYHRRIDISNQPYYNENSIVSGPLARALTSSFGTICFGSLVDLPAQMLSKAVTCLCWMTNSLVDHTLGDSDTNSDEEDNGMIENSIAEEAVLFAKKHGKCMIYLIIFTTRLHRLDRVLRSCDRWAYIYIGMYNYPYCEGGEKAIQLFEAREWMDIARDTLIQNILLMTCIVIGGLTGMVSILFEEVDGYEFTSLHKPIMTSFLIGFFLGFILSNILLVGLAGGAVNTILVCFAAEPFEFDRIHPHLSREMREVWSQQVWEPDEISRGDD